MSISSSISTIKGISILGVLTFGFFASGLGECTLNTDNMGGCREVFQGWTREFNAVGNEVVSWGIAVVQDTMKNAHFSNITLKDLKQ